MSMRYIIFLFLIFSATQQLQADGAGFPMRFNPPGVVSPYTPGPKTHFGDYEAGFECASIFELSSSMQDLPIVYRSNLVSFQTTNSVLTGLREIVGSTPSDLPQYKLGPVYSFRTRIGSEDIQGRFFVRIPQLDKETARHDRTLFFVVEAPKKLFGTEGADENEITTLGFDLQFMRNFLEAKFRYLLDPFERIANQYFESTERKLGPLESREMQALHEEILSRDFMTNLQRALISSEWRYVIGHNLENYFRSHELPFKILKLSLSEPELSQTDVKSQPRPVKSAVIHLGIDESNKGIEALKGLHRRYPDLFSDEEVDQITNPKASYADINFEQFEFTIAILDLAKIFPDGMSVSDDAAPRMFVNQPGVLVGRTTPLFEIHLADWPEKEPVVLFTPNWSDLTGLEHSNWNQQIFELSDDKTLAVFFHAMELFLRTRSEVHLGQDPFTAATSPFIYPVRIP